MKKVQVYCNDCYGVVAELVGDSDTIHYALDTYYEEHAISVHGPSLRDDWSDYEAETTNEEVSDEA